MTAIRCIVRYVCGTCGYRWTRDVIARKLYLELPRIKTPDCPACRPEEE